MLMDQHLFPLSSLFYFKSIAYSRYSTVSRPLEANITTRKAANYTYIYIYIYIIHAIIHACTKSNENFKHSYYTCLL